jgi:hypothetical protein
LNVQVVEDNEQFNRSNLDANVYSRQLKSTPSQDSDVNEEEHEDVQSFVAETLTGTKSKKSSGDSKGSKGSKTYGGSSKVSSREDHKQNLQVYAS